MSTELGDVHVVVESSHRVYDGVPSADPEGFTLSIRHGEEGPVTVMSGHTAWWWVVDPTRLPPWAEESAQRHSDRIRLP